MQGQNLTVISPTLNEVRNVPELVKAIKEILPEASIIIADDGSTDGTRELVTQLGQTDSSITLLDRTDEPIHGITTSVLDAIVQVQTKFFLVIDADLQHPPVMAKKLLELMGDNPISLGARVPYQENQGLHRIYMTKFATFGAQKYLQVFKGLKVSDPMSGLFAGNTEFAQGVIALNQKRFVLEGYKVLFDFLKCLPKGTLFKEDFYQFQFRTEGTSKMSAKHAWYFLKSLIL